MDEFITNDYNKFMLSATQSQIQELMDAAELPWWSAVPLARPHSFELYRQWIESGQYGEMDYLRLHLPQKENPKLLLPQARFALVVAAEYEPHPEPSQSDRLPALPIARYALGQDYHAWLKGRLERLTKELRRIFPDQVFLCMTDSHPVLERDLAARAGLGWIGKNSCLIHPKRGSFFLIGEIFTSLEIAMAIAPQVDHCGTCRRCVEACPTQAIHDNRTLDARLCISYWTIESRHVPPPHLRHQIGSWFFGCDICQQVCPWNLKLFGDKMTTPHESLPRPSLVQELREILTTSNRKLLERFQGTPLVRAGGRGLKRNALLMCARLKCQELKSEILLVGQELPDLNELSLWTIDQMNQST